jgi:peroxiredoxin
MLRPLVILPEWSVSRWFNTPEPTALSDLRGSVVVICAFQMLCEGCRTLALPQAQRVHREMRDRGVRVIGLHMVFENHARMGDEALEAFLREEGFTFPVGVDQEGAGWWPVTLERWGVQGTPTLVLVDKQGRRRRQKLGHVEDDRLDAEINALLLE